MYSYPSRQERHISALCTASENGLFSVTGLILYMSEVHKFQKQGFNVKIIENFDDSKKLVIANIDWSLAYNNVIPHLVFSYIHGIIETFPTGLVHNLAQELYVVSQKVNIKK